GAADPAHALLQSLYPAALSRPHPQRLSRRDGDATQHRGFAADAAHRTKGVGAAGAVDGSGAQARRSDRGPGEASSGPRRRGAIALGILPFGLVLPGLRLGLVDGALPAAVLAPGIALRVAVIEHGIDAVGDKIVGRAHDFARRAHDDGVGWNERVVGNEAMPGDDRIVADHDALHDGGADADQAVIADPATVQDNAVRDRTVVADDGGMLITDVH